MIYDGCESKHAPIVNLASLHLVQFVLGGGDYLRLLQPTPRIGSSEPNRDVLHL